MISAWLAWGTGMQGASRGGLRLADNKIQAWARHEGGAQARRRATRHQGSVKVWDQGRGGERGERRGGKGGCRCRCSLSPWQLTPGRPLPLPQGPSGGQAL